MTEKRQKVLLLFTCITVCVVAGPVAMEIIGTPRIIREFQFFVFLFIYVDVYCWIFRSLDKIFTD